jgi:hypothetical protein
MKLKGLLLLFLLSVPFISDAQRYLKTSEVGFFFGGSYYLGDLNRIGHFRFLQPAAGAFYRYNFNPRWSFKLGGYYGKVTASDLKSRNPIQQARGLSFRSNILEISPQFELNFLPYSMGDAKKPFSPYIFAGLSLFHFNPQAKVGDTWYDLQPIGTEGQGTLAYKTRPYSTTRLSFPFGIGFKISFRERFGFGAEWGLRQSNTDYIDDVSGTYADAELLYAEKGPAAAGLSDPGYSKQDIPNTGRQRGNSKNNDLYSFSGIWLSIRLGSLHQKCPAY